MESKDINVINDAKPTNDQADQSDEVIIKHYFLRRSLFIPLAKITFIEIVIALFLILLGVVIGPASETQSGLYLNIPLSVFLFINTVQISAIALVLIQWFVCRYQLSAEKIICENGFFNHQQEVFAIQNIESLKINQTLTDRFFHMGTIEMYAPTLDQHIYMKHIPNPHKYFRLIESFLPKTDINNTPAHGTSVIERKI